MCRLLGVVAAKPAPLSELLHAELGPFAGLACEHADGWGISYLNSSGLVVTAKEPVSALESSTFGPLMELVVTNAAILHLRLGSPGSAATSLNTHPFGSIHCGFAHNGQFIPAQALDGTLGKSLAAVRGDTDSERFYLAVRHRIDHGTAPAAAIAGAAADIRALAKSWESANCLLLTPGGLHVYADHSPDSEVLKRRGLGFFDIRCLTERDRVVVASTGWPQPPEGWRRLQERRVHEIGLDLTLTVRDEPAAEGVVQPRRAGADPTSFLDS
jgi:predicted glutamine amidotransferase